MLINVSDRHCDMDIAGTRQCALLDEKVSADVSDSCAVTERDEILSGQHLSKHLGDRNVIYTDGREIVSPPSKSAHKPI